jgi:hypothetical protein
MFFSCARKVMKSLIHLSVLFPNAHSLSNHPSDSLSPSTYPTIIRLSVCPRIHPSPHQFLPIHPVLLPQYQHCQSISSALVCPSVHASIRHPISSCPFTQSSSHSISTVSQSARPLSVRLSTHLSVLYLSVSYNSQSNRN